MEQTNSTKNFFEEELKMQESIYFKCQHELPDGRVWDGSHHDYLNKNANCDNIPQGGFCGGEQQETIPRGGFRGGEQQETIPRGGFRGGEQQETIPRGGFRGGEQQETIPRGGFRGGEQQETIPRGGD